MTPHPFICPTQSVSGVHVASITNYPHQHKKALGVISTPSAHTYMSLRGHQSMRLDIGDGPGDALFVAGTLERVFAQPMA